MLKRLSFLTIISLFFFTMTYTVTIAQDTKEKHITIIGTLNNIDHENETITVIRKAKKGDTIESEIRLTDNTKYVFVKSISDLESGDTVSVKCSGPKGDYVALKLVKIKKPKKD